MMGCRPSLITGGHRRECQDSTILEVTMTEVSEGDEQI